MRRHVADVGLRGGGAGAAGEARAHQRAGGSGEHAAAGDRCGGKIFGGGWLFLAFHATENAAGEGDGRFGFAKRERRVMFFLNPNRRDGRIPTPEAMETTYPTPPPVSTPTLTNVRTWNAFCHASALLGVFLHFPGHILGPLVVWLAKRHDSPEIDAHGKEALNFQISMLIYKAISLVFCLVLIGFAFLSSSGC